MPRPLVREAFFADRAEVERLLQNHFQTELDHDRHPEILVVEKGIFKGLGGKIMLGRAIASNLISEGRGKLSREKVFEALERNTGQPILNRGDLPKQFRARKDTITFIFTKNGLVIHPAARQKNLVESRRVEIEKFAEHNPLLLPK